MKDYFKKYRRHKSIKFYLEILDGLVSIAEGIVKLISFGNIVPYWRDEILKIKIRSQVKYFKNKRL